MDGTPLPSQKHHIMGYIRKQDINRLAESFAYATIDNFQSAEDMAKAVMQLSYNRNLLKNQFQLIQYIAAAIWLLAHKTPVPISEYESSITPVKYRSRLGDLAHLIVFLSYKPNIVLNILQQNEQIARNYQSLLNDADTNVLNPLAANMSRMIIEESLPLFCNDAFSFRVSKWAVTPIAKPVSYATYDLRTLNAKGLLIRCNCDLRAFLIEEKATDSMTLETLGARFRSLRNNINVTQKEFAEQIGISKLAYLRMESGHKISAEVLFKCLSYYSRIINLDVLFDKRIWELAQMDKDLLFKKVHMSSVVHRKYQLLKESMSQTIGDIRNEMAEDIRDEIQRMIDDKMNMMRYQFENGINSILALTDEG